MQKHKTFIFLNIKTQLFSQTHHSLVFKVQIIMLYYKNVTNGKLLQIHSAHLLMSIESKNILNNNSFGIHFMNDIAGDARYQTTGSIINYSKVIR